MDTYIDTKNHLCLFLNEYLCEDIINTIKGYLQYRTVDLSCLEHFSTTFDNYYGNKKDKFYENIKVIYYAKYDEIYVTDYDLIGKLSDNRYFYFRAIYGWNGYGLKDFEDLELGDNLEDLINYNLFGNTKKDFINYQYTGKMNLSI